MRAGANGLGWHVPYMEWQMSRKAWRIVILAMYELVSNFDR
jgi:hypothetical protein